MKRNSYYRVIHGKANSLKAILFALFYHFSGVPRVTMEVFLRKNFGERHFSFGVALVVAFFLCVFPFLFVELSMGQRGNPWIDFLKHYLTWYIFFGCFMWKSWNHYKAIQLEKKDGFNYEKSSVYEGDIHPFFFGLRYKGREFTPLEIECILEPSIFFGAGLILLLLGQWVGVLLFVCSIIYGLSYRALYHAGDMMILDYIDNLLYGKYMEDAYMNNMHPSENHGVVFRGRHVMSEATRKEMASAVCEQEEIYTAQ